MQLLSLYDIPELCVEVPGVCAGIALFEHLNVIVWLVFSVFTCSDLLPCISAKKNIIYNKSDPTHTQKYIKNNHYRNTFRNQLQNSFYPCFICAEHVC